MSDQHYYGCCACIGAAGNGLIPKMATLTARDGIAVNLFIPDKTQSRTPNNRKIVIEVNTSYPKDGKVIIKLQLEESEKFHINLRNPAWSDNTLVKINGENIKTKKGYIDLYHIWKSKDCIEVIFEMKTKAVLRV